MDVTFHGAARTVTGSQHLVTVNGNRVLLDCGLYQGDRAEMAIRNATFGYDPADVDAVILSHAHIDHCGNLPSLVKHGFRGRIHATNATADLTEWMLFDSAKVQAQDAAYRARKHLAGPTEPLYDEADVQAVLGRFERHAMHNPFVPAPGVQAVLAPAGHLLGAVVTQLDLEESGQRVRLVFSGDLGRTDVPLLLDPHRHEGVDYLILESTYGDRLHEPHDQAEARLRSIIRDAVAHRSRVIVPSFALGRTQDLVYTLHQMIDGGEIPPVPVFVDSPLAVRLSRVYRAHEDALDSDAQAFMDVDRHPDPFTFPELHYVESVEDSKAINDVPNPAVIIASAGMATAGRVLHHLKYGLPDPHTTVVIVSWQAPGTLGRRLVENEPRVRIFGEWVERRSRVEVINGFSAHGDRNDLIAYAEAMKPRAGVFLVHGEERQALALADGLRQRGIVNVALPEMHERFPLTPPM